jgi:hypothetical protein
MDLFSISSVHVTSSSECDELHIPPLLLLHIRLKLLLLLLQHASSILDLVATPDSKMNSKAAAAAGGASNGYAAMTIEEGILYSILRRK